MSALRAELLAEDELFRSDFIEREKKFLSAKVHFFISLFIALVIVLYVATIPLCVCFFLSFRFVYLLFE